MSRLETLRNDAARHLTALYADESLANAVALANVANQMIAVLSGGEQKQPPKKSAINAPHRLADFSSDTKLRWGNGEWHSVICGTDYAGTTRQFTGMIYNFARTVNMKAQVKVYGDTVRFRILEESVQS